MTQDEIIDLAEKAGFYMSEIGTAIEAFENFAKLVEAKERVACFDAAYEAHATTDVLEAIRAIGEA